MSAVERRVDLSAGEELDVELSLASAATRIVRLTWPSSYEREARFELAYGDDREIREKSWIPGGQLQFEIPGLTPGVHWVEVEIAPGERVRETFTVDDVSRPLPPLELRLGP